jgi:hypothetical protein
VMVIMTKRSQHLCPADSLLEVIERENYSG